MKWQIFERIFFEKNNFLFNLHLNFHFGTELLTYQSGQNGVVGGALGRSALLKYQQAFLICHYIIPDISETDF